MRSIVGKQLENDAMYFVRMLNVMPCYLKIAFESIPAVRIIFCDNREIKYRTANKGIST